MVMAKKRTKADKAQRSADRAQKRADAREDRASKREDVNQLAARIVRESTTKP